MAEIEKEAFKRVYTRIRDAFPNLQMDFYTDHPEVDLGLDIHKQKGMNFEVNLNLQGDELHLCAGHFWLEWFPCTDGDIVEKYTEAVMGLLSGEFRVLEHYRGTKAVKAELQRPERERWLTIGSWGTWGLNFGRKTTQILIKR